MLERGPPTLARKRSSENVWLTSTWVLDMKVTALDIPEVKILTPRKFGDDRGFFSETYNRKTLLEFGIDLDFVQDNYAFSAEAGTLRGIHFQAPPFAQDKLLRVIKGSVFDVAVDIRRGSPSYGKHVSAVITAESWDQILVPIGFAHACLTLEPNTEFTYKVTNYYAPEHDHGLLWSDPDLGIEWPTIAGDIQLSEKDRQQPRFRDLQSPFVYA